MSRVRTGHRPDDWLPEEPRAAHVVTLRGGIAVGISAAERERIAARARKEQDELALRAALQRISEDT